MNNNTPTLETERLILRKFNKNDTLDILNIYADEDVNKFLPWYPMKTIDEANIYLNNVILPQYNKNMSFFYAIELKETNRVIGYISLNDIGNANDVGYALLKSYWRKGYATESLLKVFEQLGKAKLPYITATHDINNPYSGEVMKKAGMIYSYTYEELWQPKNFLVKFRMYQINFDKSYDVYYSYWNKYANHYIENL